ncbi:MAG TPA: hypothetical protein VGI70_00850, partial [Polyangiales bacterium]
MFETLVVLGVVGTLIVLGIMVALLSLESLLITGLACVALGFGLGVPAGAYYHFRLYRYLAAHGGVPRGFFWNPARYHANLPAVELRRITPWFVIGALGFLMILFGCAIVMLG